MKELVLLLLMAAVGQSNPTGLVSKQLDEGSSLEMSRRHSHQGEESTAQP